jgi:hypothetical protein
VFSGAGITVNGPGIRVALRGLLINGQGGTTGIDFAQGTALTVEDCIVSNMTTVGIDIHAAGSRVYMRNTTVRGAGEGGIGVRAAAAVMLDGVRLLDGAGYGLALTGSGAVATLANGVARANGAAGIVMQPDTGATGQLVVTDSLVTGNYTDGLQTTASGAGGRTDVAVQRSTFARNAGSGIVMMSAASGVTAGAVRQAVITRHESGVGFALVAPSATATATLESSTITYNDQGAGVAGLGVLETRGNSTILHNPSGDLVGPAPVAIVGK